MKSTQRIDGLTILVNERECPACRTRKTISRDRRQCRSCRTFLFQPTDSFNAITRDGITAFWVFFPIHRTNRSLRGWVHSDHLEKPQPHVDPTPVDIKPIKPNLGRPKDPRVRFTGDVCYG